MLKSGMVSELDNRLSPLRLPHHGKPCTPRHEVCGSSIACRLKAISYFIPAWLHVGNERQPVVTTLIPTLASFPALSECCKERMHVKCRAMHCSG